VSLTVAHAGHWLTTVGFALAPLTVVIGIAVMIVLERRRDDRPPS
jgi:hypothetical protein